MSARRLRGLASILMAGALLAAAPARAAEDSTKAARTAAEEWLKLVDAGQYGESWDAAAEMFKKTVTRKQWVDALTQVRSPLGSLTTRKFRASQYSTDLPGAPPGDYVVIEYDSQFANGGPMTERITPMKDPDGTWRIAGYFVLPTK